MKETLPMSRPAHKGTSMESKVRDTRAPKNLNLTIIQPTNH
jgi:hypothetical protein